VDSHAGHWDLVFCENADGHNEVGVSSNYLRLTLILRLLLVIHSCYAMILRPIDVLAVKYEGTRRK
jgi:hypothetical protein